MRDLDPMSPDTSPGEVPHGAGVRRVNKLPVFIVGTVLALFLLVMVLVAADRAAQQNRTPGAIAEKPDSTALFADQIAGIHKEGFIAAEKALPPPVPELMPPGVITIARPGDLEAPPAPPNNAQSGIDQRRNEETDRLRQLKQQRLDEAARAKTSVPVTAVRSTGSTPAAMPTSRTDAAAQMAAVRQQADAQTRENPNAAYMARLQQLQAAGLGAGDSAAPKLLVSGKDLATFAGTGQEDRWKLDAQPEAPATAYVLRAGFVVPAVLISGINSELPGQIIAQVSQDVFDTATGNWRLVPQGARLVGRYASEVAYGQSRVFIAWQRIVFPDGKAMDIGAMPGADSGGYAGFGDQVNNHYLRLFASAFLMSGVTAGVALSQPQVTNNTSRQSAGSAISEALGQQLGQVTAQLIAKNMNIAPTLEIRPGYRFNVIVTKDMTFSKPYQAFDY